MIILWEWGFLESSKPILSSPVIARLLVFPTVALRVLVCKCTMDFERRMGVKQVKRPRSLAILTTTHPFFLNQLHSDCQKPLVNFQSSEKKLILTIFTSVLVAFMKMCLFRGHYSAILKVFFLVWVFVWLFFRFGFWVFFFFLPFWRDGFSLHSLGIFFLWSQTSIY